MSNTEETFQIGLKNAAEWKMLSDWVRYNPQRASAFLTDANSKRTTILHKALMQRNVDDKSRLLLVNTVLEVCPQSAQRANYHGSYLFTLQFVILQK